MEDKVMNNKVTIVLKGTKHQRILQINENLSINNIIAALHNEINKP